MRLIDADKLKDTLIATLERIKKNPKMSRDEMHIIAACDTMCMIIDDMPTIYKSDIVTETEGKTK